MYSKGDYVNYSTQGICEIEDIRLIRFNSDPRARRYYILKPVQQKNACIYVPVDNQKLIGQMCPVLSSDEIDRIILSIKNSKISWIEDRKQRASEFQSILSRRDEKELLQLASCLYLKSKDGTKGLCSGDLQILKKVETIIAQEFSFSLKIDPQDIGTYIRQKLNLSETNGFPKGFGIFPN